MYTIDTLPMQSFIWQKDIRSVVMFVPLSIWFILLEKCRLCYVQPFVRCYWCISACLGTGNRRPVHSTGVHACGS